MKSFFNFLRNNKAYTLIDIFGLSISFMFVILIGAYAWQETHIDHWQSKADRIYAMGFVRPDGSTYTTQHWIVQHYLRATFPEIEKTTSVRIAKSICHIGENYVSTNVMEVDSTYLDIFDIDLIAGDPATVLSDYNTVIVSEKWAKANFGDENPIGKRFTWEADTLSLTVSGIMSEPTQTMFVTEDRQWPDVIMRVEMEWFANNRRMFDPYINSIGSNDIYLLGAEGVDLSERVDVYQQYLRENFGTFAELGDQDNWKLAICPLKSIYPNGIESSQGNHIAGNLNIVKTLGAVGGVVLLFALLNYVNLTVALAGKRAKEMATRRLLGSRRTAIVMRLIGESALLCALSLVIGIGLAMLVEPYCYTMFGIYIDIKPCITPDTIGITLGLYALMSIASGIIPAIMISGNKPIDVVRGAYRRKSRMIYSKVIIVIQNTITIAMIVCSLGMVLQVRHLINAPLGYDISNKIAVRDFGIGKDRMNILYDELQKLPFVKKISKGNSTPVEGGSLNRFERDGKYLYAQYIGSDSMFFNLWNIEKLRDNHITGEGRWVTPEFLVAMGLDEDAEYFQFHADRFQVAGIIKDFHTGNILDEQNPIKMVEIRNNFHPWCICLEYTGDPTEAYNRVCELYDSISTVPHEQEICVIEDYIGEQFRTERNLSAIMTIFAIVAIIISLLGLLAISTYYVQQREREIAVRKVFGSTASGIIGRVTRSFVVYVIISFALAVPIAYMVLSDWLSQYSYRIPVYWWLFALAFALTIGITAVTVYAQSRQAANSNPINALNHN